MKIAYGNNIGSKIYHNSIPMWQAGAIAPVTVKPHVYCSSLYWNWYNSEGNQSNTIYKSNIVDNGQWQAVNNYYGYDANDGWNKDDVIDNGYICGGIGKTMGNFSHSRSFRGYFFRDSNDDPTIPCTIHVKLTGSNYTSMSIGYTPAGGQTTYYYEGEKDITLNPGDSIQCQVEWQGASPSGWTYGNIEITSN